MFALTILIPSVAKERASPEFIFTHFNTENGMGIHQKAYILAVGLLMSQYSVIGYDTSAHMVINLIVECPEQSYFLFVCIQLIDESLNLFVCTFR